MNPRFIHSAILLLFCASSAKADWRDETGFTRLQLIAGAELPTTVTDGLTQVEAFEPTANYVPDIESPLFLGKNFTLKSGASTTSNHAQHVATNFYATTSQLPGSGQVDLYSADNWLSAGFLKLETTSLPATESRAVQSHSWISNGQFEADAVDANRRLDYAIQTQGFICVVGQNNSFTNPLPQLLGQGYHSISVGRSDGNHSAGLTTLDGVGRIKPDIVAPSAPPESATSWTTPMVAGAAGLLVEKISQLPVAQTSRPLLVKSLLMASARKDNVSSWSNTTSRPLDLRYGSGNLNTHHAYLALNSGRKTASLIESHGIRGWSDQTVTANTETTWFFTIPPGAANTPFCAALTWNRSVTTQLVGLFFQTRTWDSSLANLDLRLHHAADFTVGEQITASLSTVDNVELVYQSALAPGDYALVVDNTSPSDTPIGLAWHSLPSVNISAPAPLAREMDGQAGTITLTRSGDTTLPLWVPLTIGGTALPGTHYQPLPASVMIPAGQSSISLAVIPIADALAQGDRSVILSIAADFASVTPPGENALVTIQDKPFDAWRFAKFSTSELNDPQTSGETADPDRDDLANLIEYALGLEPKIPDASPITAATSSGHLAFLIAKNPAATDISWSAEVSDDLTHWQPAFIETNDATTFAARDTVLINAATQRFIRLKISRH